MTGDRGIPARFTPLALLAGVCLIVGVWARFWGLWKWPLAIDEYYFARSVENVLRTGLPQFPCGGLYVRGLLLQYLAALLELGGLSAELAPRLLASLSSLATLPAVFLLARRLGGRNLGLLAVAILAISVWEIEIARFGRMYAPFQALFAWYLVFYLAYSIDRRQRALAPLLILSAVGVLLWEGGVLLALTNLLAPFIRNPSGRLDRREWIFLGAASLLLIPAYYLTIADLRSLGSEPLLPPDYQPPPDNVSLSRLDAAAMPLTTLSSHPWWALGALIPAAVVLFAGMRVVRMQRQPLAALGLIAALLAALLQQFQLALGLVVIVLLLSVVQWQELIGPAARPLRAALLACVLFWSAFGLSTHDWHAQDISATRAALLLGYQFIRFPDVLREVVTPFARTVPVLALALALLVAAACVRACRRPDASPATERVLLALVVILLFGAGASHPPRHETRYVFFLYPVVIVIALATIARAAQTIFGPTRTAAAATVLACLGGFMLTEDFRPLHLWNIDSAAVNFRIGMSRWEAAHYHPRSDVRAAAVWLRAHVDPGHDLVIDSYPGVDFYYRNADFYFVEDTDPRFEVWSCRRGTVQRWSNLPMIHSFGALNGKVAGRRVWMVLETSLMQEILSKFPASDWTLEWTSATQDIVIVALRTA